MIESLSVLYVEDDQDIAEEFIYFLKPRVKNLYSAKDGAEGLDKFKRFKPDLVITDIQMPRMNGLEMCEKIRQIDINTAIIVTSAYNDNDFLARSIELAITSYLVKPVAFSKLLERLEKVSEPLFLKKELEAKNEELVKINENLDAIASKKTEALEYFYRHERITGLYNLVRLKEELLYKDYGYLLLLDISNFAVLNKQYGKRFADDVLVETARALEIHVNKGVMLFKAESDRFVFLLQSSDQSYAEYFCKQLISFFDSTVLMVNDHPISIGFNMGITQINQRQYPMINAEYALDKSKKAGSRFYAFYSDSDELYEEEKEMIRWLDITKEMVENEQIIPYYQPIFNFRDGSIKKYEVLARGIYENQIIEPINFLESAKLLGMMTVITRMMINASFSFFQNNHYYFSINISERDLVEDYLIDFLRIKLEQYNILAYRVTFEVLESITNLNANKEIITRLKALKAMGFKIAVDDFGVESSNFSRLSEIDFDYIKIDGLFIQRLDRSERDKTIVRAIVNLAKTMGIETTAEFVVSEAICQAVRECGVDNVQGYYIGKPEANIKKVFTCKDSA
jgi:EAL domain-containing protein (putative c-di-GMP-specific phosphodiesterase class I)/CheY-like chemotaxis protein